MSLEGGAASLARSALAVTCGAWAGVARASARIDPAIPNIFRPASTPADSIYHLSVFVLAICAGIFLTVFSLLVYAVIKFRRRKDDDGCEPPQIYGSNQMELAWTVIPIVIVFVLFLAAARVIHAVEDAKLPPNTLEVTAIGHQFWWEFQYPQQGFITANELHVPVGSGPNGAPTHIKLLSADTDHSFWVPQLAGKTDLIPNHPNEMWIEPHQTGVYVGQCAQYCGVQHAKMLLRVIVESPEDFQKWAAAQKNPAVQSDNVAHGREVFESTACVNCHTVAGTNAHGKFGPDLTHLMSRETIASGAATNNRENLRAWIKNPDDIKPGALMPAMQMSEADIDAVTDYMQSLR
ncbi:MAG: cytochrome c oxidase subunit II [Candidatus Korobacteraceae bacterium]